MNRAAALLFSAFIAVALTAPSVAAQAPQKPLTVDAIFAHGPLIGTPPEGLTWSPDAKHLTYLEDGELIDLDPGTGKPHVLVSHTKLAAITGAGGSETDRDHRDRYKMASYLWAPDSEHLLFDSSGRLWLYDLHNGIGVEVGFTGTAAGDDPKFSPNGNYVSFVRDHGLAVVRLRDPGTPTMIVAPAPNTTTSNGEVDWLYLEELEVRSNYFWSPDSKKLVYLQMNQTEVPLYPLTDWIPTHASVEMQRYPQPGDPNPNVRVGVVNAQGSKPVWINLPIKPGQDYIPRFGWVDPKTVWIETITRDQKHRDIYFADASTGQAHPVLQFTDENFFDDKYDVAVGSGSLVLTNWADGHNHLYLYSYDAANPQTSAVKLERQLTKGEFDVGEVLRVDSAGKQVIFASNEGNPLEQQIWQASFDGQRKPLTTSAGSHVGNFSPAGGAFVDKHSTRMDPPTLSLCRAGSTCTVFWQTTALEPYHLRAPEQLTVKGHDGTTLFATLLLPEGTRSAATVPLIVNPYGGPGAQTVTNRWSDSLLFDELLAQHGFAVLHADNRGTPNRGRDFAQAAYHNFGPVQLEDQLTVVDATLAQYPQLDSKRQGVWGWSWGGSFTLFAMTHSDRFRAGVAVAPVTDWRNYDSTYVERYMSQPAEFAAGYKNFSVVTTADRLKGRLLLVHGTGDDNVHMENTIQFVQKLIEAGIPYDLQLYPRKTHSLSGPEVRTHLYKRILAQFEAYLKPGE
ncbi:MAG: DPP IV N-terminal domain-containing protein [Terracidiphilus sp.]|nr:DPP IV N-terminal domain-containing protein [Terracidiphilus sp.]MDR3777454.1 DPP IV N-terminal domain-containing protein [Terracidiphilus sp.]